MTKGYTRHQNIPCSAIAVFYKVSLSPLQHPVSYFSCAITLLSPLSTPASYFSFSSLSPLSQPASCFSFASFYSPLFSPIWPSAPYSSNHISTQPFLALNTLFCRPHTQYSPCFPSVLCSAVSIPSQAISPLHPAQPSSVGFSIPLRLRSEQKSASYD